VLRLLAAFALSFLLYARTIGYPLIEAVEPTGTLLGANPLVELAWLAGGTIGGGADWGYRLLQVSLLALLAWVASGGVQKGARRGLVLLLVICQPMMLSAVMDPRMVGELLAAVAATLALTTRGRWAGVWTLLAVSANPVASVLPILGRFMPPDEVPSSSRWPWRIVAVAVWWGIQAALNGAEVFDSLSPGLDGLMGAGAHGVVYARQLFIPMDPIFARELPLFTDVFMIGAWIGWVLVFILGVWTTGKGRDSGPSFMAGLTVLSLPLLLSSAVGDGALVYSEARLAWPAVGMAWMLAALAPLRMASFAFVPLWFGVAGLRAGDHASPADLWDRVHSVLPEDPVVLMALGNALVDSEPDRAVGLLESALVGSQDPDEALQMRRGLVQAYMVLDRRNEARRHLAVLANPEDEGAARDMQLRCLLAAELGDAIWEVEAAPIAEICAAVVAEDPTDIKLLQAAGVATVAAGHPIEGREYLIRAVELQPEDTHLRQLLSNLPLRDVEWHTSGPAIEELPE